MEIIQKIFGKNLHPRDFQRLRNSHFFILRFSLRIVPQAFRVARIMPSAWPHLGQYLKICAKGKHGKGNSKGQLYAYMYFYVCIYIYDYIYIYVCVCMYVSSLYIYMYKYLYKHTVTYKHMCVCVCAYVTSVCVHAIHGLILEKKNSLV